MLPRCPTVAFLLKPFLWRRPDVRLWYFFLSPLCGVAKTPDCGIISLYLFDHLSRCHFRHPIGSYLCSVGISGGLPPFPFYLPCHAKFWMYIDEFIRDASMHAFVISYVRTVLRVLSKYSLACWFVQMLTKAISWMKSLIASPMPRGVSVSPVRSYLVIVLSASATQK